MKTVIGYRRQEGSALVEFAIVAPFMLLLLLGVAELGRAFYQYNIMTKAVRDGARYVAEYALAGTLGVVYLTPELKQEAQNMVVWGIPAGSGTPLLPGWTPAAVTVSEADAQHVQVSATYAYQPMLGAGAKLPTFGLGDGPLSLDFTFHASVVMRAL